MLRHATASLSQLVVDMWHGSGSVVVHRVPLEVGGLFGKKEIHVCMRISATGRICVVLLAGGDGSRLGFPGPKGALPVGPLSGATLFQLFAERIRRVQLLAERAIKTPERVGDGNLKLNFANQSKEFRGACVPLLVMTSASNHLATKQFFRDHGFFGLKEENVEFFLQGTLPVFDLSGRLILSGPGTLAEAPDGNGGVFEALNRSGALRRMKERGVVGFHVLAVDNALAKPADPTFLGFAVSADAQVRRLGDRMPTVSLGN